MIYRCHLNRLHASVTRKWQIFQWLNRFSADWMHAVRPSDDSHIIEMSAVLADRIHMTLLNTNWCPCYVRIFQVGSANTNPLQLFGPSIQPRHCLISLLEGVCTVTPLHADAVTFVNGHHIQQPTILHVSKQDYIDTTHHLCVDFVVKRVIFEVDRLDIWDFIVISMQDERSGRDRDGVCSSGLLMPI